MGEIVDANGIRTASSIYVGRLSPHHAPPPPPAVRVHVPTKKSTCSWWSSAETKRRKRVARYKLYTFEGKFKASLKHGFRWIKKTSSRIVHGF